MFLPSQLSPALESEFFRVVLKAREVEALKARCESFQAAEPPAWRGPIFEPYSQYFGFLSALKVRSVLAELQNLKILPVLLEEDFQLVDFGAGTLGATLGACDFLKEIGKAPTSALVIDRDEDPMRWAAQRYSDYLPPLQLKKNLSDIPTKPVLFLSVDVLNELKFEKKEIFVKLIQSAAPESLFVFLEPASKEINQRFLKFRDELLEAGLHIQIPCTHEKKCPALQQGEWCHEDRNYKAPSIYWNLVHSMGFERRVLSFSLMVLSRSPNPFRENQARIVSRELKSKGRADRWFCANGERWKSGLLLRQQNEGNAHYFESQRGEIVDVELLGLRKAAKPSTNS